MARSRNLDDVEMGFISPDGQFIAVPFGEHAVTASDILDTLGYESGFIEYPTDVIIDKFGYILIDGCHDIDIQTPNIVTQYQKITLGHWLVKNKRFIKWLSRDSIENLRKCLEWLDEGITKEKSE